MNGNFKKSDLNFQFLVNFSYASVKTMLSLQCSVQIYESGLGVCFIF